MHVYLSVLCPLSLGLWELLAVRTPCMGRYSSVCERKLAADLPESHDCSHLAVPVWGEKYPVFIDDAETNP